MLMPTIADSEIGVSTTRRSPNSSCSPCVTPNAPPYGPTSSPSTKTFGSRRISSASASRIASRYDSSLLIVTSFHEDTKTHEDHEPFLVQNRFRVLRGSSCLRDDPSHAYRSLTASSGDGSGALDANSTAASIVACAFHSVSFSL